MQIALALAVAGVAAPLIRSVMAELNQTVGTVWPFSLTHCRVSPSPGCAPPGQRLVAGRVGWCGRHECNR